MRSVTCHGQGKQQARKEEDQQSYIKHIALGPGRQQHSELHHKKS